MENVKQVIVIRKDLNMRKGKMVAQGAHASLGGILQLMERNRYTNDKDWNRTIVQFSYTDSDALKFWLEGKFRKICLSVDSEEELLDIYNKAKEAKLNVCLITDAGDTEFNGVPTKTCLSIGPDFESKIDEITKQLKLL